MRSPVITVMGHVDHGKTSLLDAIRKSTVADAEAGGITQHIGAYQVDVGDGKVTFLDTPGHEAFTEMRGRGAKATDVVVLVVAADDGVMPQTAEAINHARAAQVPIVVAINKIDKEGANLDQVRTQLAEYELISEDWGGDTIFAPVSAHTGEGLDSLLDNLLLQAEVLELKANPERRAIGVVIESRIEKGRGTVLNVLVQNGTLRRGDIFVCGQFSGRVRGMMGDRGEQVEDAGPSVPVEVIGASGPAMAGEDFYAVESEAEAKNIAQYRATKKRTTKLRSENTSGVLTLQSLSDLLQQEEVKELPLIVKGDVQGSVEAVSQALEKLTEETVAVKVIHKGVGGNIRE